MVTACAADLRDSGEGHICVVEGRKGPVRTGLAAHREGVELVCTAAAESTVVRLPQNAPPQMSTATCHQPPVCGACSRWSTGRSAWPDHKGWVCSPRLAPFSAA